MLGGVGRAGEMPALTRLGKPFLVIWVFLSTTFQCLPYIKFSKY